MIDLKVFCPFERVSKIIAETIYKRNPQSGLTLNLSYGDYSINSFSVDAANSGDVALRFSEKQRRDFLSHEAINGLVGVYKGVNLLHTYSIKILNAFMTDKIPSTNSKFKNSSVSDGEITYAEALRTTKNLEFTLSGKMPTPCDSFVRPFYNYFVMSVNEDQIIIGGPKVQSSVKYVGMFDDSKQKYNIFVDSSPNEQLVSSDDIADEEYDPVSDVNSEEDGYESFIIVNYNNVQSSLKLSMISQTLDGIAIEPKTLYYLMKCQVHYELNRKFGSLCPDSLLNSNLKAFFNLNLFEGKLSLTIDDLKKIETVCLNDKRLDDIFRYIDYTSNYLVATFNHKIGYIQGSKTQACFALSLCSLLCYNVGFKFTNFLYIFNACLDNNLLFINDENVVEGKTSLIRDKACKFILSTIDGCRQLCMTRKDSKDLKDNTMCLLGYDINGVNKIKGIAEHYCVVQILDNRVIEIYDPLNPSLTNLDMTDILKCDDSILLYFDGTISEINES